MNHFLLKPAKHWLDAKRVNAYSAALLFIVGVPVALFAWEGWDLRGQPLGFDFVTFWTASRLTLDGMPLQAYSFEALLQAQHSALPKMAGSGPWFYPPTFLLIVFPLALLPCAFSFLLFIGITGAIFIKFLRRILPMREALLPILAFPGIWLNGVYGQNGFVTATLAGCALVFLERRPVLAGACIGMLSIKPHLAILFPIALICARMWIPFVSAAITAALLTGVSMLVFGTDSLYEFLSHLRQANSIMSVNISMQEQAASVFTALRMAHVPITLAYAVQACVALAVTSAMAWVWLNSRSLELRSLVFVAATFLSSPFIYNYDAVWLGVPIALYISFALRSGWLRGEREILLLAWLYPLIGNASATLFHVSLGPLVFLALMFLAIRRAMHHSPPASAI